MKSLSTFFIQNSDGEGLHYIQGSLYWRKPDTVENVTNFTPFDTPDEAANFAIERRIPGKLFVGQIVYSLFELSPINETAISKG